MIKAAKNDDRASRALEGAGVHRRALFCGLMASGSLVMVAPAVSATGEDRKAAQSPDVGTVWWSELQTQNAAAAADFYAKVIGWQIKTVAMDDGSRPAREGEPSYTLMLAGKTEVAGAMAPDDDTLRGKGPMWLTYFEVDDVDAAIKRALAAGGTVIVDAFNVAEAARMAVIADTEGVPVGLASPL
jgi:predicted enzyme related to lactoylglutathione lyase